MRGAWKADFEYLLEFRTEQQGRLVFKPVDPGGLMCRHHHQFGCTVGCGGMASVIRAEVWMYFVRQAA